MAGIVSYRPSAAVKGMASWSREKKKKADAVGINKGGTAELTSSLESGVVL